MTRLAEYPPCSRTLYIPFHTEQLLCSVNLYCYADWPFISLSSLYANIANADWGFVYRC